MYLSIVIPLAGISIVSGLEEVAKSNLEKIMGYDFIDDEGNTDLENR